MQKRITEHERVIRVTKEALRKVRDVLRKNLVRSHRLVDAAVIQRLLRIMHSRAVCSAIEANSDTALATAMRAVNRTLHDLQPDREIIDGVWKIVNQDDVNRALDDPENSRTLRRLRKSPSL